MVYSSYTNCTMVFWHVNKCKCILTNDGGFEVHEHRSGYMFPGAGLDEEGVEGLVSAGSGLVGGHVPVRLNAVLQTVQLPARVTDLHSRLTHVNGDTLALQ